MKLGLDDERKISKESIILANVNNELGVLYKEVKALNDKLFELQKYHYNYAVNRINCSLNTILEEITFCNENIEVIDHNWQDKHIDKERE